MLFVRVLPPEQIRIPLFVRTLQVEGQLHGEAGGGGDEGRGILVKVRYKHALERLLEFAAQ